MRNVPDWAIQTCWWISGIFATGAVWYFLSIQNYAYSGIAAICALSLAGLAIWLHRIKDAADAKARPKPEFTFSFREETVKFSVLARSLNYDIVKVLAHTHMLGVMAEHAWIDEMYPGCVKKSQTLTTLDGIQGRQGNIVPNPVHFDVLEISLPNGPTKKIYFDISSFFDGEGLLMDPKTAVAQKLMQLYGRRDDGGGVGRADEGEPKSSDGNSKNLAPERI